MHLWVQTTQFDGAQGKCTNGGVKIEVLIDGKVDDAQTQYICNGTQAQSGQYGINSTLQTAKFDDEQGGCTNGGVKIEILVDGKVEYSLFLCFVMIYMVHYYKQHQAYLKTNNYLL